MLATLARTEPRPFEDVLIASTLESAHGREALMEQIHRLSQERTSLQTQMARHPWRSRESAARIRTITTVLEACWTQVRRERAAQRVQLEAALGIDPAAGEQSQRRRSQAAHERTHQQARGRHRALLPRAS